MVASRFALVLLPALFWAVPSDASTFLRKSLDQLALDNETIVQARVLDIHSYWNAEHTFILTDVRIRPSRVLKGAGNEDLVFTVPGGTVGDVTILVLGGPDLEPGSEYVLFLGDSEVPGAIRRFTIPDHAQGAFQIAQGRVLSQAVEEPLLPDETGSAEVAGGSSGFQLEDFFHRLRFYADR